MAKIVDPFEIKWLIAGSARKDIKAGGWYDSNENKEQENMSIGQGKSPQDEHEEQEKLVHKYWIQRDNIYIPSPEITIVDKVIPGLYNINWDDRVGLHLKRVRKFNDKIISLPMPEIQDAFNDIKSFWSLDSEYNDYGLTHKRGILLHGPPGCGKTYAIQLISQYLVEQMGGIVFNVSDSSQLERYDTFMSNMFREIEPNTPIVVTIEDIDGFVHSQKTETILLNILDGMSGQNKVVYIATTNFPEQLGPRLLDRPSRFDRRYELGYPKKNVRKVYLENIIKKTDHKKYDIDDWVDKTRGLTLAHLRELMVSVIIMKMDIDETIGLLKDLSKKVSSDNYKTGTHVHSNKPGFGNTDDDYDDDNDDLYYNTWHELDLHDPTNEPDWHEDLEEKGTASAE